MRYKRMYVLAAALLAAIDCTSAAAQGYPDKSIVFVVPFAAGSATDGVARIVGQEVTRESGQRVVVDDRPGANGFIGAQLVAKAAPDGYTAFVTTNTTHAANQHLFKQIPYDPVRDYAPVTALAKGYQVMVVNPRVPAKTVRDFTALAKKTPGRLTFGEGSSSARVAVELYQQMSGAKLVHVPYKSNPLGITDLIGGQIDVMIVDIPTGLPQVQSGRLRGLAVTSRARLPQTPDLPTMNEAGIEGYEMSYWFAAYLPAKTPVPVVKRLNELMVKAVATDAVKSFFAKNALESYTTTPEQLAAFQDAETEKWGRIIRAAGIQPE
ncbi:MAG: Bug family tripartite tricarboxylate transporter substrate binding protein [Rhodospirillaceae bacterium]